MIYLSGRLQKKFIGLREDLGVMVSYRSDWKISLNAPLLARTVWAADNGCFNTTDIDVDDYYSWLESLKPYQKTCLFAVAPDVVANAEATLARSFDCLPVITSLGYNPAYVIQNGQAQVALPRQRTSCVFVGGDDDFKESETAYEFMQEAKARGKWVHMGRVNTRRRLRIAITALADSVDGTGIKYAPDKNTKQLIGWLDNFKRKPYLKFIQ